MVTGLGFYTDMMLSVTKEPLERMEKVGIHSRERSQDTGSGSYVAKIGLDKQVSLRD